jgi:hypothetical protein
MSTSSPNKPTALSLDQKHIGGVDKYFSSNRSILLAGTDITPAALKAVFQDDIDATNALDAAEAQAKQRRATQRAARKKASATRRDLKAYILGNYGPTAVQMLDDFGFTAPKPRGVRKVATKAQAVAQAEATRKARHTMGKKQRAKVKGKVPAADTTTTPATPATTATTPNK